MVEEKKITCVICPNSCVVTVKHEGDNIIEVTGHSCKRGLKYASAEAVHPVRSISSTVRCADGRVVAVKTSQPVPKENVYDVMWEINHFTAPSDIAFGDVVIPHVYGLDADVVVIGG